MSDLNKEYEIELNGEKYDLRNNDDRLVLESLGYFENNKDNISKNNKIIYVNRKDSLPLNTEYIQDMDYKYYGLVTLMSRFNGETACEINDIGIENAENHRYFYKDWLYDTKRYKEKQRIMESLSGKKIRTIRSNVSKLVKAENNVMVQANKEGKIYYKIQPYACEQYGKMGKFVTIDEEILRYMVNAYSSNTIKIYCIIKILLWDDKNSCYLQERQITRDFILRWLGLNDKLEVNLQMVTDCISAMTNKVIKKTEKRNEKGYKSCYYSLMTLEEFKSMK